MTNIPLVKQVGFHIKHAYARSLARFAANLGPIGWAIAAEKIERVLPPGTKFGRGWIDDSEAPRLQSSQPPLSSASPPPPSSSERDVSTCAAIPGDSGLPQKLESPSNHLATEVSHLRGVRPLGFTSSVFNRLETVDVGAEPSKSPDHKVGANPLLGSGVAGNNMSKPEFPFQQNVGIQSITNGYSAFGLNFPSQLGKVRPARPPVPLFSDAQMTHSRALDMVSRNNALSDNFCHPSPMFHLNAEKAKLGGSLVANSSNPMQMPGYNQEAEGPWWGMLQRTKQDSVPPDLNVRFQSPGSPASTVLVDAQKPDLALQL